MEVVATDRNWVVLTVVVGTIRVMQWVGGLDEMGLPEVETLEPQHIDIPSVN